MIEIVFGTMLGTWLSFLVGLFTKNVTVWPFWLTLIGSAGFWITKTMKRKSFKMSPLEIITVGGWGIFLIKLFSQMLIINKQGIWAGGSNVWGDWAGHIGYIANWIYGANWPPQNPWYAGVRLSYPFLFDYTSAILVKSGFTLPWSLQLPGIIFGIILVWMCYRLTRAIFKSDLAGAIAVAIFMLSGGLGFLLIPHNNELTHSYEANIQWVNFVISEMVPQRGILLGIVAALVIFWLLWQGWDSRKKINYLVAGIVLGMVPLFHAHTFMAVVVITGFLFVIRPRKLWWYFFVPAIILGLPQFAYFVPQVSGYSSGFVRWQLGWAAHVQHDNWVWFWIKNVGLMFFLIPLAWITTWKKDRKLFWIYVPFLLLFLACNVWVFQPWENDNSKLLRFWYLGSAILVGGFLAQIAGKKWPGKLVAGALLVLVTISGAVDAGWWLNFSKNKLQMWSQSDTQLAEFVKNNTSKTAIFLTNDNHNHWVVDLAGRKIVLGFRGWLWSWGINYSVREADVNKIFRGDPNTAQLLAKYNIDYVVVGPGEISNFKANQKYFEDHYPLFLDRDGQKIFDVR